MRPQFFTLMKTSSKAMYTRIALFPFLVNIRVKNCCSIFEYCSKGYQCLLEAYYAISVG
jgi:hypothetical protein